MSTTDELLSLTREAISAIENNSLPLSSIINKCIRIARLRNDTLNYWWLSFEMINIADKVERKRILSEIITLLPREACEHFHKKYGELWFNERSSISIGDDLEVKPDEAIQGRGVGEIEALIDHYSQFLDRRSVSTGMHPLDQAVAENQSRNDQIISSSYVQSLRTILSRINARVYDFLIQTEKQLVYGDTQTNIFEENREYVILLLGRLCPDALGQFNSAYTRMNENDKESWAQALTSCRRLLKSLADALYPPSNTPIIGSDGKERILDEKKYIGRLRQYVYEKVKTSASAKLLIPQIQDLGNRIDNLYDLTCKGVHDEIGKFEVNQCVIQTFMTIGDILRISQLK